MKRFLGWLLLGLWFVLVAVIALEYVTERSEPRDPSRVTMPETP